MRTLTFIAIVAGLLHPWDAFANFPKDTQAWPGYNMIGDLNPGFENGTTQWTATAGGTFSASTTVYAEGLRSAAWTPSASGQYLTSPTAVIGLNINTAGRNGVASCLVRTAGTGYTLEAIDGSSNVLVSSSITSSSTGFVRVSGNFIFPNGAGTSVKVRIKSAGTTIAYVDSCYIGPAEGFNISQVSQAQLYGAIEYAGTASCNWTTGSTSNVYTNFGANSSCPVPSVSGNASAPGTKIPAIVFNSLPPGEYYFVATGIFGNAVNNVTASMRFRFNDGSNGFGYNLAQVQGTATVEMQTSTMIGRFAYSTAQSNVTIQVQSASTSNSNNPFIYNGTSNDSFRIMVYRFPSSSELAVRSDQAALSWAATTTLEGSNSATGSPADLGSITGSITATTASQNLTCSAASSQLGITCNLPRAGVYEACLYGWAANSGVNTSYITIADGSNNVLGYRQIFTSAGAGFGGPVGQCVQYNAASAGNATIKFRAHAISGTVSVGLSTASIKQITTGTQAPVFVGSVTSNSTGADRVERAKIRGGGASGVCNSSPCTISDQTGSWLSSVTRSTTGQYTINFAAGAFSAAPTCVISGGNNSNFVACLMGNPNGITTSVASVFCGNLSGAAGVDAAMELICMGPR